MMPLSKQHRKTLTFAFLSHTSSLTRTSVSHSRTISCSLSHKHSHSNYDKWKRIFTWHPPTKGSNLRKFKEMTRFFIIWRKCEWCLLVQNSLLWFGCCDWSLEHCHAVATMFGTIVKLFLSGYIQVWGKRAQSQNVFDVQFSWHSLSM